MKIKKLSKLPKRNITIDNLLEADDINDVIEFIQEHKLEISHLVCLMNTRDGIINVKSNGLDTWDAVALLEMGKALYIQDWVDQEE